MGCIKIGNYGYNKLIYGIKVNKNIKCTQSMTKYRKLHDMYGVNGIIFDDISGVKRVIKYGNIINMSKRLRLNERINIGT